LEVRREGNAVVVHIAIRFYRRMGRQTLLTPDGHVSKPERQTNGPLVEAIVKAHRWQEQLEAGEYASVDDIAHAHKVNRTYIGRLMRLTSLAPDIVEAILRGEEPSGMSLEKLRRALPVSWAIQRERWL